MATAVSVTRTNISEIDGLLAGTKWSGTITYSFPDSPTDYSASYYGNGEPTTAGFALAPYAMQLAINYAISLIAGYTNASIQFAGNNGADIAIAQSPAANPTSYAYYPANVPAGGDIWFGTAYNYSLAALGNYYFTTALHELGHAVGLKHSQETGGVANVAVPTAHDDSEYTVMSYRAYAGAPLTGYTNESYGYPQTYMANDILALQTLYGANFSTHSENTVYSWNTATGQEFINGVGQLAPGTGAGGSSNRVYETIWDGNGIDTYDLSNYTTAVSINLNPGASSITSTTQLAYLGDGHYAAGNIYNAYAFNGDLRSYIDNAVGGSGNDALIGNAIANTLNGGAGNDTLTGGGGNDTIIGGAGTDVAVFSGADSNYLFTYNSSTGTFTVADQRSGSPDGTDTITGVEYFQFSGGTFASSTFSTPVVIESLGSTSLVLVGNNYFLKSISSGSGPELKYAGAAVAMGQFGSIAPIGAEQTATGYKVAWKTPGIEQFTVWNTDSNGNFVSNDIGLVSGTSSALETLETGFHQDLNGDGVMGAVITVTESLGLTSLAQVGSNYFLNSISSGSGPELKYASAAVAMGQFGSIAPIGAEQSATGYKVAWKTPGIDQFTVWNTDSNGNFVSNDIGLVSGTSSALKALETSFQQDLNGDGVIGAVTTVTESAGSTNLTQVGSNYFLNSVSSGSGPELKYASAAVAMGQFGSIAPIGAEQTATGYQVAWKTPGIDQFTVWNTDSNGNFVSNDIGLVSGTSSALETLETGFHQDLNGDGVMGAVITVTESLGLTSLAQVGSNYFLNSISSGSGPELKYASAAVAMGQFGSIAPIGAEQTATGYKVAWKTPGIDQFTVWNTDSNGNFVSNNIGLVSGTSSALKALETSFQQDLNGDGLIGVTASPASPSSHPTSVTVVGNDQFVFRESLGANDIATLPGPALFNHDGFLSPADETQFVSLVSEVRTNLLNQSPLDDHSKAVDLDGHDSQTLHNIHIADLRATDFFTP